MGSSGRAAVQRPELVIPCQPAAEECSPLAPTQMSSDQCGITPSPRVTCILRLLTLQCRRCTSVLTSLVPSQGFHAHNHQTTTQQKQQQVPLLRQGSAVVLRRTDRPWPAPTYDTGPAQARNCVAQGGGSKPRSPREWKGLHPGLSVCSMASTKRFSLSSLTTALQPIYIKALQYGGP